MKRPILALLASLMMTPTADAGGQHAWRWGGDSRNLEAWTTLKTFASGTYSNLGNGRYLVTEDFGGGPIVVGANLIVDVPEFAFFQARLKVCTATGCVYTGETFGNATGTYPIKSVLDLDESEYTIDIEVRVATPNAQVRALSATSIIAFEPRGGLPTLD